MRITGGLAAVVLLSAATAASAQTWQQAYERGDFPAAAPELQAIVFEHAPQGATRYPDLQAIQSLAQMYADGRGVAQDSVTACALANLGSGAAVYQHGERDPRTKAIQRQVEAYCVPLSASDRREAMSANGCFQLGVTPSALFESPTKKVEAGRTRLTIVERGRTREYSLAPFLRCAQQAPVVRYSRVPAPKGSKLQAREFVEIFSWHSSARDGRRSRTLEWSAVELLPQSAVQRARTLLERGEGSAWPARPVPARFAGAVKFSMLKSGDVRWQMAGRTAPHGLIGKPSPLRADKAQPRYR